MVAPGAGPWVPGLRPAGGNSRPSRSRYVMKLNAPALHTCVLTTLPHLLYSVFLKETLSFIFNAISQLRAASEAKTGDR
jgi:hypothetical protein